MKRYFSGHTEKPTEWQYAVCTCSKQEERCRDADKINVQLLIASGEPQVADSAPDW